MLPRYSPWRIASLLLLSCCLSAATEEGTAKRRAQLDGYVKEGALIPLKTEGFNVFVAGERDYGVFAFYTAGWDVCFHCGEPHGTLSAMAEAYMRAHGPKDRAFYFLTFDARTNRALFEAAGVRSLPTLIYYPPEGKPGPSDTLEVQRFPHKLPAFVHSKIGEKLNFATPTYWPLVLMQYGPFLALFAAIFALVPMQELYDMITTHAQLITMLSLCAASIFFTSGMMWNSIRGAGLLAQTPKGLSPIAGGTRNQTVIECWIIMALNGGMAYCFVMLVVTARTPDADLKNRVAMIVAVLFLLHNVQMSIFAKFKNPSYPWGFFALNRPQ